MGVHMPARRPREPRDRGPRRRDRHDADLVLAAFAALRFPLDEIEVFHTDRGGGFTGERIERMLDVFGITRSLSGPGNPYDNAVVEGSARTLAHFGLRPSLWR